MTTSVRRAGDMSRGASSLRESGMDFPESQRAGAPRRPRGFPTPGSFAESYSLGCQYDVGTHGILAMVTASDPRFIRRAACNRWRKIAAGLTRQELSTICEVYLCQWQYTGSVDSSGLKLGRWVQVGEPIAVVGRQRSGDEAEFE